MVAVTSWAVSCDFDGTLTRGDVVNAILDRFAEPAWLHVEAEWRTGVIGSRECLERQTRLLRVTPSALADYVDQVPVDPDAAGFFDDCGLLGLSVGIVSDGYDWVIHRILGRIGVVGVPVIANRLTAVGGDRWTVEFPHAGSGCGSGVCKCQATATGAPRLHIGDGRSDACVADQVDRVFATGWLLDSRVRRGAPCTPFHSFADVRRELRLATAARAETGTFGRRPHLNTLE